MGITKKAVAMLLCSSVMFCSACSMSTITDKLSGNGWKSKAEVTMPAAMGIETANQIYLCGTVYSFPFKVSELINNGWSYSPECVGAEERSVDPRSGTDEWVDMISSDGNQCISILCYNDSTEGTLIKDTYVASLKIDCNKIKEAMLSGGAAITDRYKSFEEMDKEIGFNVFTKIASPNDKLDVYQLDFPASVCENNCNVKIYAANSGPYFINRIEYNADFTHLLTSLESNTLILDAIIKQDHLQYDLYYCDYEEVFSRWRDILCQYMVIQSGFNITELTEEEKTNLNEVISALCAQVEYSLETDNELVTASYTYPNTSELIDVSIQDMMEACNVTSSMTSTDEYRKNHAYLDSYIDCLMKHSSECKIIGNKVSTYAYEDNDLVSSDDFVDLILNILGLTQDESVEGKTDNSGAENATESTINN